MNRSGSSATGIAGRLEESTVLTLGDRGAWGGRPFVLAGRTCMRGRKGAISNEWAIRFLDAPEDEPRYFLAEAAGGSIAVMEEATLAPSWDDLEVGVSLATDFVVVERGEATRVARWGDVDDEGASTLRYADLSSRTRPGVVASIDYGAKGDRARPPRVFEGRRRTLGELGLRPRQGWPRFDPAPNVSRPKGAMPCLDIGDEGVGLMRPGDRCRVLGLVSRRNVATSSTWDEYLIYDTTAATEGLRWLVVSDDGHWSIVAPVDAGRAAVSDTEVRYEDLIYPRLSERATAKVEWAAGELPWQVAIGETAVVEDFVHAPWILTREQGADGNDLSWSRAEWISPETVAKAFGSRKRALPKPIGRAPNA